MDAPYFYRYNRGLAAFGGSEALNPEILDAFQFQTVWKSDDKRIREAATLFYQTGTNLVVNRATAAGTPADPKYINSGEIKSVGIENEFSVTENAYKIDWNFQYSQALSATDFARFDSKFAHVPQFTTNLIMNYTIYKGFVANASVQYIGEQVYNSGSLTVPVATAIDASTLINLGARHENLFDSGMFLDARIYNLAETLRFQGGQSGTQIPFRQAGRWYFASLGREF